VVSGPSRTLWRVVPNGWCRFPASPQSAQQIHQAATATAGRVAAETRLVIDPERRDSQQTALLATLAATAQVDAAKPTLRQPIAALLDQARPLMAAAERTTSRSRMLFAGRNTKNDALVALGQLQSLMAAAQLPGAGPWVRPPVGPVGDRVAGGDSARVAAHPRDRDVAGRHA